MTEAPAGGVISGVRPGSLAAEAGIEPGDAVLTIAGRTPRDVVDLQFYQADREVLVHFRKANGLDEAIVFEKEMDEDLGLEFERATWDDVTLCNNNCFFCFLKGLPKGMRKSLYMKDDDYRLSFLHGNFVTLTNLREGIGRGSRSSGSARSTCPSTQRTWNSGERCLATAMRPTSSRSSADWARWASARTRRSCCALV